MCPGGETGRRKGLKILFPATGVRVQFPPRAPSNKEDLLASLHCCQEELFWRDRPLRQNGRLVNESQYDTQLHTMLKRLRPKLYREHTSIKHSVSIDLVQRLEAARARLIAIKRQEEAG